MSDPNEVCKCGHERLFHYSKTRPAHECQWPLKPGVEASSWKGGLPYKSSCNCYLFRLDPNVEPKVAKPRGKPCEACGCGKGKHFDLGLVWEDGEPRALCECGCTTYIYNA